MVGPTFIGITIGSRLKKRRIYLKGSRCFTCRPIEKPPEFLVIAGKGNFLLQESGTFAVQTPTRRPKKVGCKLPHGTHAGFPSSRVFKLASTCPTWRLTESSRLAQEFSLGSVLADGSQWKAHTFLCSISGCSRPIVGQLSHTWDTIQYMSLQEVENHIPPVCQLGQSAG